MATTYTQLLQESVIAVASTSYVTTATVTPVAGRLLRAVVTTEGGAMTVDPSLSGGGVTWVLVNSGRMFNQPTRGFYTFRAMGTGSAGALTFARGGSDTFDSICLAVDEVQGVDTSGANGAGAVVQTVVANSQESLTPSVSISMTAGNEGFAFFAVNDTSRTSTPRTDWTELADVSASGRCSLSTQYRQATDTAASNTWSSTGSPVCVAIVWEIKPAATGSALLLILSLIRAWRRRFSC